MIEVVKVVRYGQISGTTRVNSGQPGDRSDWPRLVDGMEFPLLTDTGRWGVLGVDEGANAEHSDGRLYFFFGDVATDQSGDPPENSDLIAWTDEQTVVVHGGHEASGPNFQIPQTGSGVSGQDLWQFCLKCSALFWNGDPAFKGACPNGGGHDTFGVGLDFTLPFGPTKDTGQAQWRSCARCAGLFWASDPGTPGTCPAGGTHAASGIGFLVPTTPSAAGGQQGWRGCLRCDGLFWDGEASKGLCSGVSRWWDPPPGRDSRWTSDRSVRSLPGP